MRRIIPLAIVMVTLLQPMAALALTGGPTLKLVAPPQDPGQTFTVNVVMDTKTYSVTAAELHITFASDKVQALSIVAGTFLPSVLTPGAIGSGTASITLGSGTTPKQGNGTIAVLTFKYLASGVSQIAFDPSTQIAALGQTANAVDTMTPLTVTRTTYESTPTPTSFYSATPMPYATPTPIPTGIAGVSRVQTGPGETTLLGLILASIITLLYVGYAGSDAFRRNEAESYSKEARKSPPNFKK